MVVNILFKYSPKRDLRYENTPIQVYWKFYHQNLKMFRWKILFFLFLPKNIDCRYPLEPLRRGGSNGYQSYDLE